MELSHSEVFSKIAIDYSKSYDTDLENYWLRINEAWGLTKGKTELLDKNLKHESYYFDNKKK